MSVRRKKRPAKVAADPAWIDSVALLRGAIRAVFVLTDFGHVVGFQRRADSGEVVIRASAKAAVTEIDVDGRRFRVSVEEVES